MESIAMLQFIHSIPFAIRLRIKSNQIHEYNTDIVLI